FGNGGMLVTDDGALAKAARLLRDPESPTPLVLESRRTPAYLDPLQAACVKAQLGAFERVAAHHADLAGVYAAGLAGLPLTLPQAATDEAPTWYWYVIFASRRDALRAH